MNRTYRPDIDGLRSLAVLPIVLYHAGVGGFSGGFVGVDIFFVISGYLITQIIHSEIQKQSFSILKFYARRARRILPALFFMCLFTVIASWYILLPSDFQGFSSSLFWTMLFSSNIHFWQEAGYFAGPSEYKPLLHTWSLAVEEQFYLFFPISLVLISKYFKRHINNFIFFGFIASFLISVWGIENEPNATFYLIPTRAWELLMGSILALNMVPISENKLLQHTLAFTGVTLILWSIFTFTVATPFPGPNALFPCLGTALIIYSNSKSQTLIGNILSIKPLVFFGLISYSLYLWHWPLIVFLKYQLGRPFSPVETILILLVSMAMAMISWEYIEQPFRHTSKTKPKKQFYYASFFVGLILATFALFGYYKLGFPDRWTDSVLQYAKASIDTYSRDTACSSMSPEMVLDGKLCIVGSKSHSAPDFIVWGDSHARVLLKGIEKVSREEDITGWFASRSACPPLLGIYRADYPLSDRCRAFNDAMLSVVIKYKIKDVFLIARWSSRALGYEKGGLVMGPEPFIADDVLHPQNSYESKIVLKRALERTISKLNENGVNVYIFTQVPVFKFSVPKALAKAAAHNSDVTLIGRPLKEHLARHSFIKSTLDELETKYKFTRLDPTKQFCGSGFCRTELDGHSLYKDDNHLSSYGAVWISSIFKPPFERIASQDLSSMNGS